jgi:orotate phosphoribosyltransferase
MMRNIGILPVAALSQVGKGFYGLSSGIHRVCRHSGGASLWRVQDQGGRLSPYFFNAGLFNDGAALGGWRNSTPRRSPPAASSSTACSVPPTRAFRWSPRSPLPWPRAGRNLPFSFNRKEAKDHGEGGSIVGAPLAGRVLIIDDVITAGTSVRESVELIRAAGASPCGVVIALDRMERGRVSLSAVQEVEQDFGIPVLAVATLDDLLAFLQQSPDFRQNEQRSPLSAGIWSCAQQLACCLFLLALAGVKSSFAGPRSSVATMIPGRCAVTFCRRRVMGAPIASSGNSGRASRIVDAPLTAEQRAKRAAEEQRRQEQERVLNEQRRKDQACSIPTAAKRISRPCAAAPSGTSHAAIKAAEERSRRSASSARSSRTRRSSTTTASCRPRWPRAARCRLRDQGAGVGDRVEEEGSGDDRAEVRRGSAPLRELSKRPPARP